MGLFTGKKGLVLGVANDFSIAWAITQKLRAEGAEIGFTHLPGDKMERRVRKLAEPLGAKLITPCDVQKNEDVARVFAEARDTYGSLDFVLHSIAFAPIEDIKCPFAQCSREGFKTAMDISVYSLVIVARHAAESMPDGGAIATQGILTVPSLRPAAPPCSHASTRTLPGLRSVPATATVFSRRTLSE